MIKRNLYDLSTEIDPDQMKPFQIGFIWRVGMSGAFLQRLWDAVDLCVIGSGKFRMYIRTNGNDKWEQATQEDYDAWVSEVKAGTQIELDIKEKESKA